MSNFYPLEDDDAAASDIAGPSQQRGRNTAGVSLGSSAFSTPATSRNGTRSHANPIAAMLEPNGQGQGDRESLEGELDSLIGQPGKRSTPRAAPVVELRDAWTNERAAPVLLPWQGDAVDGVCSQIEEQITIVDSLAADASTGEEEHVRLALVELDVERARWLLRSYLRCRLDKIEQNADFVTQDVISRGNMSELERGYAVKYAQICSQHFHASVLDFLPENMRSLDDRAASGSSGRGDMVTRPDLEAPIFVRCREDCGTFRFPGTELLVHFEKGSIHLVRYRTIQHLIAPGKVELL